MLSAGAILADVQANWFLYLSMPFVASIIGYTTKLVAIRMMFEPIHFVGIPPFLGWQGIVPRKAQQMAEIACDTLTRRLLTAREMLDKLDARRVAIEIEQPLFDAIEDITREVAARHAPGIWEAAPELLRRRLIQNVQAEAPRYVEELLQDTRKNLDSVFDLKAMLVDNLVRDKRLLNRMFREIGANEFRFIAHSGIYFGFVIGCVQAVTWALTHNVWVMPLFGGFTGWFTDWLALKMVFRPKLPTRYLGVVKWQGLFHKRREEVLIKYGELIVREIVTPQNVLDAILRGPAADRLYEMVLKNVQRIVDEQAGIARPLMVLVMGGPAFQQMKGEIAEKMMQRLPDALKPMEQYAEDAMDLQRTLAEKTRQLSTDEYEGLLRPAFQQDEWILIAVGAALGFLVGETQVFIMTH
ncbi:MAG: DUF445 domain-containing protein [Panacagrimonas sp.]